MSSDNSSYIGLSICFLIIAIIFYYIFQNQLKMMRTEGMTNNDTGRQLGIMNNKSSSSSSQKAYGTNAEKYTDAIKTSHNTMKDNINIPKYRTEYENMIIELNDYVDGLMFNELLDVDPTNADSNTITKKLDKINKLSNGKQNLNQVMKYLDAN
jgi:hypothetical protein